MLHKGVRLFLEPPRGLKPTVLALYSSLQQGCLASCDASGRGQQWQRLVFAAAVLHGLLCERRRFGPMGYNVPYEFTDGDFSCALSNIQGIVRDLNTELLVTPAITSLSSSGGSGSNSGVGSRSSVWEALLHIVGAICYGGRVTDAEDRRLLAAIMEQHLSPEVLSGSMRLGQPGVCGCGRWCRACKLELRAGVADCWWITITIDSIRAQPFMLLAHSRLRLVCVFEQELETLLAFVLLLLFNCWHPMLCTAGSSELVLAAPTSDDTISCLQHIHALTLPSEPPLFGLHPNAAIACNKQEGRRLLQDVFSMQHASTTAPTTSRAPAVAAAASGPSAGAAATSTQQPPASSPAAAVQSAQQQVVVVPVEVQMAGVVKQLLAQLPQPLSTQEASILHDPLALLPCGRANPMGVVLRQEMDRWAART